jgi:hypothetical protein
VPLVLIALVVIAVIFAVESGLLPNPFAPQKPPPVQIVNLKIGGKENAATALNNTYTEITFDLKNNDGSNHSVTVMFELTPEASHHVSITTQLLGRPLPKSGNSFYYNIPINAADTSRPQHVFAWAHMSGVPGVTVEIKISLLVDNKPVGQTSTVTLSIST